jgi:hypothetical protein
VTCASFRSQLTDDPIAAVDANAPIAALVRRIAREVGIDENQFLALVYQESRFDPCAKSRAGAMGLAQLMPGTAADLGVDPSDIEQNLRGGALYYKQQLARFGGDMALALAAYNAGHGNVTKHGGIPPFKETRGYVRNITRKWLPALRGTGELGPRDGDGNEATAATADNLSAIVAMLTPEELSAAKDLGFEVIADEKLVLLGKRMARLRVPSGLTLAQARKSLAVAIPEVSVDVNHYHRPESAL